LSSDSDLVVRQMVIQQIMNSLKNVIWWIVILVKKCHSTNCIFGQKFIRPIVIWSTIHGIYIPTLSPAKIMLSFASSFVKFPYGNTLAFPLFHKCSPFYKLSVIILYLIDEAHHHCNLFANMLYPTILRAFHFFYLCNK